MKHLKEYKEGQLLSKAALDEVTDELLYAKFKGKQASIWADKINQQHGMRRTERPNRQINWWMMRAAAAIILALCIAIPFRSILFSSNMPSAHLMAEHIIEPFENNTTRKDISADASELRIDATTAYNNQNYAEAVRMYEQVVKDATASVEDYLYLGLSALYNEQMSSKAVKYLKLAKEKAAQEERYEAETQWFLALAYLQDNQPNRARPALEKILSDTHWQAENAETLLNTINALKK